jgi:hypothetical protein
LLLGNVGLSACGVHWCRARWWHGARYSGGEGYSGSVRWRSLRRARRHGGEGGRRATMLWHGGDAGRLSGGAMKWEARWRAPPPRRRSGARSRRAVTALRWGEFFLERLGANGWGDKMQLGCIAVTIGTIRTDRRLIPRITASSTIIVVPYDSCVCMLIGIVR